MNVSNIRFSLSHTHTRLSLLLNPYISITRSLFSLLVALVRHLSSPLLVQTSTLIFLSKSNSASRNARPSSVNTARVDGWWKPVTHQLGPLTRAVNSGSGNRTWVLKTQRPVPPWNDFLSLFVLMISVTHWQVIEKCFSREVQFLITNHQPSATLQHPLIETVCSPSSVASPSHASPGLFKVTRATGVFDLSPAVPDNTRSLVSSPCNVYIFLHCEP